MNYLKHASRATLGIFMMIMLSSCGPESTQQFVTDFQIKTKLVDEQVYIEMQGIFDLGNVALPSLTLPIRDPRHPEITYGSISMAATFTGKNQIGVSVNMNEALKIQGGRASLPNGNALPVGGLDGVDIIQIPIPNTLTRVYLALDHGVAMAGVAVSIRELDQVGGQIGNVNLFPRFQFDKVIGVAGVYTGQSSGQTGIALFVDISSVLNQQSLQLMEAGVASRDLRGRATFQTIRPQGVKKARLEYELFKLGTSPKKKYLHLH